MSAMFAHFSDGLHVLRAVDGAVTTFAWDWATGVPELLSDGLAAGGQPTARYLVGHDTLGWEDAGGWTTTVPDALGSVRQAVDGSSLMLW